MARKNTNDILAAVATEQHELFQRIKDGTLDPTVALNALRNIIQHKGGTLNVENLNWTVSSKVHEIRVQQESDFVNAVKSLTFSWKYDNWEAKPSPFVLAGNPKTRPYKARIRLAKLHKDMTVGVVETYANLAGYDLATPWEMLAFMRQSSVTQVIEQATNFIALGSYGWTEWSDTKEKSCAYVEVADFLKGKNWSFQTGHHASTPEALHQTTVQYYEHILLKERT